MASQFRSDIKYFFRGQQSILFHSQQIFEKPEFKHKVSVKQHRQQLNTVVKNPFCESLSEEMNVFSKDVTK